MVKDWIPVVELGLSLLEVSLPSNSVLNMKLKIVNKFVALLCIPDVQKYNYDNLF